ncbi:MAG: YraN family protein [Clostridiaceae bacterium]
MNKRGFGKIGENIAADYLIKNGFEILDRNFRSGRFGELDIIAAEDEYICFIEVKTRTSDLYGSPVEAVSYGKREKIKALAWIYLKYKNLGERNMRFDIVEVTGKRIHDEIKVENINLIRSAY